MTPPTAKDLPPLARARDYCIGERDMLALWLYAQGLNLRQVGERISSYGRKNSARKLNPAKGVSRETTRQILLRTVQCLVPTQADHPETYRPTNTELAQWAAFIIAQLTHECIVSQANIRSRSSFLANHPDPTNPDDP